MKMFKFNKQLNLLLKNHLRENFLLSAKRNCPHFPFMMSLSPLITGMRKYYYFSKNVSIKMKYFPNNFSPNPILYRFKKSNDLFILGVSDKECPLCCQSEPMLKDL